LFPYILFDNRGNKIITIGLKQPRKENFIENAQQAQPSAIRNRCADRKIF
jgi:hypothetical protein